MNFRSIRIRNLAVSLVIGALFAYLVVTGANRIVTALVGVVCIVAFATVPESVDQSQIRQLLVPVLGLATAALGAFVYLEGFVIYSVLFGLAAAYLFGVTFLGDGIPAR